MGPRSLAAVVTATCTVLLLAGCATGPASKNGTEASVLRFASIDNVNDNGQSYGPQAFLDALVSVSGGRLRAEVTTKYEDGLPRAEVDLLKDITAGRLDGGWPATRAFAAAGLGHLAAVEAPMTITSYSAQKALATSPTAAAMLSTLSGSGAVGLGLAVGPLRRPFAARAALLGPADWKGARFRVFSSPVQRDAVRALGGTPVDLSYTWIDEMKAGHLRGGESDAAQYLQNGYTTEASEVAGNVVLWPKMYVLTLSQKRYDSLSPEQQRWVRAAAARAVKVSTDASYDDAALATRLCASGVHLSDADPATLAQLQAALRPVLKRIASTEPDGSFLQQIQALATAPADVLPANTGCATPVGLTGTGSIPDTRSNLPSGVYRVQINSEDVKGAGLPDGGGLNGIWTLTVHHDQYALTCRPAKPGFDCGGTTPQGPVEAGDLRGRGHDVYLVYNPELLAKLTGCLLPPSQLLAGHCTVMANIRMRWTLQGDQLTFSDFHSDGIGDPQYLLKPWQKIA